MLAIDAKLCTRIASNLAIHCQTGRLDQLQVPYQNSTNFNVFAILDRLIRLSNSSPELTDSTSYTQSTDPVSTITSPGHFLTLPVEICLQVYTYLSNPSFNVNSNSTHRPIPVPPLPLL